MWVEVCLCIHGGGSGGEEGERLCDRMDGVALGTCGGNTEEINGSSGKRQVERLGKV